MPDFTLIATADWDHPLWTNKQHVAKSLNELGHRVLYVESLGLRAPRKEFKDWKRIVKRLSQAFSLPREVWPGLWVWSPLAVPGAGGWPPLQQLNRWIFSWMLWIVQGKLGLQRQVLWTYNPCTLDYLISVQQYQKIVYHCVDDIQSQPGMNADWLNRSEQRLCAKADVVFATSPALLESRSHWTKKIFYYPNVADYEHFARAASDQIPVAKQLSMIPKPRLGFVGALSAYKVDFELLEALANRRSDWSFVLVGPIGEGEQSFDLSPLTLKSNVHWLGVQPYEMLPSLLKGLDIALLPLRFNQYTEAMFPMKFFEYLAAGLPIVATPIRSLYDFRDLAHFPTKQDPVAWEVSIEGALADTLDLRLQRMAHAAQHTYSQRTQLMLAHLWPSLEQVVTDA